MVRVCKKKKKKKLCLVRIFTDFSTAKQFVKKLLVIKPSDRMTAEVALQHPWIVGGGKDQPLKTVPGKIVV